MDFSEIGIVIALYSAGFLIGTLIVSLFLFMYIHFFRTVGSVKDDTKLAVIIGVALSIGGFILEFDLFLGFIAYIGNLLLIKKLLGFDIVGSFIFIILFGLAMRIVTSPLVEWVYYAY